MPRRYLVWAIMNILFIYSETRMPGLLDLVFATDTELEKYHYSAIQRSQNCIRAQKQVPRLKGKTTTFELTGFSVI